MQLLVAVGDKLGRITGHLDLADTMQAAISGRPELNFIDNGQNPETLAIDSFLDRLSSTLLCHDCLSSLPFLLPSFNGGESGSLTRLQGFRVLVINAIHPPCVKKELDWQYQRYIKIHAMYLGENFMLQGKNCVVF